MSHVQKKKEGSILWVVFEKGVQFCELNSKKVNSWSHLKKKKLGSLSNISKRRFNSLSRISKNSILWVVLLKGSIFWVIFHPFFKTFFESSCLQKRFNSVDHIQEKASIHWDILKKKVQFSESSWKGNNSLLQNPKKFHSLRFFSFDTRFNSLSHSSRKSSILRVIFEKIRAHFFESYSRNPVQFFLSQSKKFNISHVEKKGSLLWVKRRVQFCESFSFQKKFNSVSHVSKRFNSLSHFLGWKFFVFFLRKFNFGLKQKKAQFFESYCWKKKFNSLSPMQKKLNSFSQIQKGVQHFVSIFVKKIYSLSRIDQKSNSSHVKKEIHMEERFNSLSILKKVQLYWKTRKVQFFAT